MILTSPAAEWIPLFPADEPVVQGRPLHKDARRPDARIPLFGDTRSWDYNGILERPANFSASEWKMNFTGVLEPPAWNLLAREVAMILSNPQHETLQDKGIHLGYSAADVITLRNALSYLRGAVKWGRKNGLPDLPSEWEVVDLKRHIKDLAKCLRPATVCGHVGLFQKMHAFSEVLTVGWPTADPWPGKSARQVSKYVKTSELSTQAVAPEIWFPLIRAAWAYIHTFAPDILRAVRCYGGLRQAAGRSTAGKTAELKAWLADPDNKVPVYYDRDRPDEQPPRVNWRLMALFLGVTEDLHHALFSERRRPSSRERRGMVLNAVSEGRFTHAGPVQDLTEVTRADSSVGRWHPGFDAQQLHRLQTVLRDAAFVLVAALSMMRDSELHKIGRNCIVEHYNSPAIASTLSKGNSNKPRKHWWISEPVAEAIAVAEIVSVHPDRVFAPIQRPDSDEAIDGSEMVSSFIAFVNEGRDWSGLDRIPEGDASPHMFRKTMAMLTDQFAGSEIALGIQLKHIATRALANSSTRGYAAADDAWAKHLENAIDAARFRRLKNLYQAHKDGEVIGFGHGADRVKAAFDQIIATVKARNVSSRVEEDLLRKAGITIRFGVLNNCLYDASQPAGAVCLENAIIPEGHTGPLPDRCRPDRCGNSMIGVEHVPIYDSHHRTQLKLLQTPGLAPCRRALITREAERAEAVLNQVQEASA
ncbi:integrase [Streptomyces sp. YPW6]|uniref:integrase n=1 Tax=Streptomyces sp. YPW6 TaxID=2840373 RepID=UPI001C0C0D20|nr:integrase [Streptomyces sp. YPW6]QWQ43703.1 integrase [Streptomyces sp. YPW6]